MLDHSARLKLLDEIKKRPFLYDRDDPHYQDKEMRQNAWKEIASKFKKYNDNGTSCLEHAHVGTSCVASNYEDFVI